MPALLLLALLAAPGDARELRFLRPGAAPVVLSADTLAARCGAQTISLDDPYYGARKTYRACPLAAVLQLGFGLPAELEDAMIDEVTDRLLAGYRP